MSLVSVWDELWEIIAQDPDSLDSAPASGLTKLRRVFKAEPVILGADPHRCAAITWSGSQTADYWVFWLRIYFTVSERPKQIQIDVATTVDELEALLDDSNRFEIGDWDAGLTEDLGQWVAAIQLRGPRER